ncbi:MULTISPECIES: hypothetical protein [Streptomyces]|uniref:hypothetical protein n=1 Tax=Streptomyces TaxID=1883 RepID=UPI000E690239|nr:MULTISPECIES: hypothetical protein [Streptomyces]MDX3067779.1 hypothetical protein [Streptomyces sp. ND04-05B]MDX3519580.1 hypothetical protein [Streptomyces scabiei]
MCLICRALGALAASGLVLRTLQLGLFATALTLVIAPARAILLTVEDTFGAAGLGVALLAASAAAVALAWNGTPSRRLTTAGFVMLAVTALVLYGLSEARSAAAQAVPHAISSQEGRSLLYSH